MEDGRFPVGRRKERASSNELRCALGQRRLVISYCAGRRATQSEWRIPDAIVARAVGW